MRVTCVTFVPGSVAVSLLPGLLLSEGGVLRSVDAILAAVGIVNDKDTTIVVTVVVTIIRRSILPLLAGSTTG